MGELRAEDRPTVPRPGGDASPAFVDTLRTFTSWRLKVGGWLVGRWPRTTPTPPSHHPHTALTRPPHHSIWSSHHSTTTLMAVQARRRGRAKGHEVVLAKPRSRFSKVMNLF